MCPSTTPVADDDEADELLPPPPPPLAAAAAAAAEEAPLADAALEDPVPDDDEAELLPPPPPPLAAAAAAAAEEAPLADAALPEDDAAVEEVAPHTSNRRAYGCSTARRPAALLQWISRMPWRAMRHSRRAFRTFSVC